MAHHKVAEEFTHRGIVFTGLLGSPESLDEIKTLSFREDDIIVATYTKSGETASLYEVYQHEPKLGIFSVHWCILGLSESTGVSSLQAQGLF